MLLKGVKMKKAGMNFIQFKSRKQVLNNIIILLFIYTPLVAQMSFEILPSGNQLLLFQGILFILFFFSNENKSFGFVKQNLFKLFVIFLIISLITSLFSSFFTFSLRRLIITVFEVIAMFYFLENIKNHLELFKLILKFTLLFVVGISIYSIVLYHIGSLPVGRFGDNYLIIGNLKFSQLIFAGRTSSIFANPNSFGFIVMLGTGCLFGLYKLNKKSLFYFSFFMIFAYALTMSRSRSSILGVVIIIAVYVFFMLVKYKGVKIAILFSTIVVILGSYVVLSKNLTLSGREDVWALVISSIIKNPIFGVGFGVSNEAILSEFNLSTHNIYLKVLSEIGIFGFISFLTLILNSLIYNIKVLLKSHKKNTKRISLFFVASLVAICSNQFFESGLFIFSFTFTYWLFLIIMPMYIYTDFIEK